MPNTNEIVETTPVTTEVVATPKDVVLNLIEDVALRHEPNQVNIKNNRGFALLSGAVVEVVRRGKTSTRIRKNLEGNTDTELVSTADLAGYTHPNQA